MKSKKTQSTEVKTVLIVDDEKLFLASLTEGMLEFADEFKVVTALNGQLALDQLRRHEVDLVVTDLKMSVMDGFQLLAEMSNEFPNIPVIVMTAFGTPEIEKHIKHLDAYSYLEKPIDYQLLASKIRDGITHNSEGHLKGIMLSSFLQLLQMEQKTCALKITTQDRKGMLYFSNGELIEAVYKKEHGEKAAQEIVCWEDAEIEIVNSYKKIKKRITKPLQNLLMDAAKEKDEAALMGETENVDIDEILSNEFVLSETNKEIFVPAPESPMNEISRSANKAEPPKNTVVGNSDNTLTNKFKEHKLNMANNIEETLDNLMQIDGAMAVALVDLDSGMALGTAGGGVNLEVAAAGNTEVVKSKQKVMSNLGLKDKIEDILISLGAQYHIIRPLRSHQNLFLYLVLGREKSNLAMARFKMNDVENAIQL